MQRFVSALAVCFLLSVTACGDTSSDRVLSGGALGAGAGMAAGALVGGLGVGTGALIGTAAGAIVGGVTDSSQLNAGKPVWRR